MYSTYSTGNIFGCKFFLSCECCVDTCVCACVHSNLVRLLSKQMVMAQLAMYSNEFIAQTIDKIIVNQTFAELFDHITRFIFVEAAASDLK